MAVDPKRVKEIFLEAADLADEAARAAYLDRVCAGDAGLRARVDALLRSHDPDGSFLGTPAAVVPDPQDAVTGAFAPAAGPAAVATSDSVAGAADDEPLTFLAPSTRADALGRIGHYEVLQVLGRGGFGIVFRAFDDVLQRVVALKVLAPQLAATSPARKRFLREARSSAQVRHENVVQVHEVGEQPLPYLVMEFIPGETLQQRLDRTGPLDVLEVLRIGRQVAEGLAAAHAHDLIHRDIKPGNILLESGPNGHVKITDFGLARAADDASISQSGVIAGTPMYMAPEQAQGQPLDQRADLFSLGSVLYQMTSGRPPFRAASALAVLKRVAEDRPRDIREIIPEAPPWLCTIIAKLHEKQPEDRYPSARAIADVLADCEQQLKAHGALKDFSRIPGGRPARRATRRWQWAAALVLLLLPIAWGVYSLTRPGSNPEGGAPAPSEEGWVSLFNGTDLTGWKRHANAPGDWQVEDGTLVGQGATSFLFSDQEYENFHLRMEAKINASGDAGVLFRAPFDVKTATRTKEPILVAPMAQVSVRSNWKAHTGSLLIQWPEYALAPRKPHLPDEWVRLEVIAEGNRLRTLVNGKLAVESTDDQQRFTRGHLALHVWGGTTSRVQFRKIEIKELSPSTPAVPQQAADVLPYLAGNWKIERQDHEPKAPPDKDPSIGTYAYRYVAGGKFLRGGSSLLPRRGGGTIGLLDLWSFEPGQNVMRRWLAQSDGWITGGVSGQFNPANRILTTSLRLGDKDAVHQYEFADSNTFYHQVFVKDANGMITYEFRNKWTRVDGPAALPSLPPDPNRPAEMSVLDRLTGEWSAEATVTEPGGAGSKAREEVRSVLGGRLVEMVIAYEPSNTSDYALAWFDAPTKQYRQWGFRSPGTVLDLTGSWNEAAKTLTWQSMDRRLEARWVFQGDDRREFQLFTRDAAGPPRLTRAGVSRRVAAGWVPLFNGKDLTGWKQNEQAKGEWKVHGGNLTCGGGACRYLFTERGDFENFHLRAEVQLNKDGDSGIFFRSRLDPLIQYKEVPHPNPAGYEVQIASFAENRTGSLWVFGDDHKRRALTRETELDLPSDQWFTLEVVANGRRLQVFVNGRKRADVENDQYRRGHIALQHLGEKTAVQFRKIEIKELPTTPGG